jgi:hypothetical protein
MELEDDILEELRMKERSAEALRQTVEDMKIKNKKIIEEKEKTIEENKKELEEKDKKIEEKEKEIEELRKLLEKSQTN